MRVVWYLSSYLLCPQRALVHLFLSEYGSKNVIQGVLKWHFCRCISMVSLPFILKHSGKDQFGSGHFLFCLLPRVCMLCPSLFHMCLTLLWQGCPASQGRWRMSEARVEKQTASQHLDGMKNTLAGWLACDTTAWEQSKGWRPVEKPQMCVWNIILSRFCSVAPLHMHMCIQPPKNYLYQHTTIYYSLLGNHLTVLHPLTLSNSISVAFHTYRRGQMQYVWHLQLNICINSLLNWFFLLKLHQYINTDKSHLQLHISERRHISRVEKYSALNAETNVTTSDVACVLNCCQI